jgi:hypothetical protein
MIESSECQATGHNTCKKSESNEPFNTSRISFCFSPNKMFSWDDTLGLLFLHINNKKQESAQNFRFFSLVCRRFRYPSYSLFLLRYCRHDEWTWSLCRVIKAQNWREKQKRKIDEHSNGFEASRQEFIKKTVFSALFVGDRKLKIKQFSRIIVAILSCMR